MNLIVSGVTEKNGEKKAFVMFDDDGRIAEGSIPDCKIIRNDGFTEEEVAALEDYLKDNLSMLKRKAAEINPIKAFMK